MTIQKTKTNPFSVPVSPTHRVGLTEAEILELLTWLQDARATTGLTRLLASANLKLNNVYEKANMGNKVPDYVPTGKRREGMVNLDSLGASDSEKETVKKVHAHKLMSEEEQDAELDRLEAIMLEGLRKDGIIAAEKSVIAGTGAIREELEATDNDSVHAAFMNSSTIKGD